MINFISLNKEKNKTMGTKKIKISHQRDKCIGCGSCASYAPNYWRMNAEDGKADLIGGKEKGNVIVVEIEKDDLAQNKKAAKACPMQIIKVHDE